MTPTNARIIYRYLPEVGEQQPVGAVDLGRGDVYYTTDHPCESVAAAILAAVVSQQLRHQTHNPFGPGYQPGNQYPEGTHEFQPDWPTLDRVTLAWYLTSGAEDQSMAEQACLRVWQLTEAQLELQTELMAAEAI